jgi:hypothetical protein
MSDKTYAYLVCCPRGAMMEEVHVLKHESTEDIPPSMENIPDTAKNMAECVTLHYLTCRS